jgi:nucleotide-binding universal stress UspA family protein
MKLRHIVAATDESEAGRQGVRAALALSAQTGARVTIMRTVPVRAAVLAGIPSVESTVDEPAESSVERLQRWVEADLAGLESRVSFAVTGGLPGVEIGRFAEREWADLLVLGRKPRSLMARLVVGDTADAVARRCTLPCLFVVGAAALPRKVLVAIDDSERAMAVLAEGESFARQVGASLHVVTVEARHSQVPAHLAGDIPDARSVRLSALVRAAIGRELEIRHGDPVAQILAVVSERRPDVLVIGCHRGGPPGIIEAGNTARRLAHAAPCAILTVPPVIRRVRLPHRLEEDLS